MYFRDIELLTVTYTTKRSIRFADTNLLGQVHFDLYVRLMEETEYAFLRSRGLRVVLEDGRGVIGFPRLRSDVQIIAPLCLGGVVETTLRLVDVSGKKITYEFDVTQFQQPIATGTFEVACCRFPDGEDPYAILIPEFVSERLSD